MTLLRFDQFQRERLYGPDGFYITGGAAGAAGDFITAPELGEEFGAALAVELDRCWFRLGRPDPFIVVEGGAGVGTLASTSLRHVGDCRRALRWVMVEISAAQRDAAMRRLADELPIGDDGELSVVAVPDLRPERFAEGAHVVVANELLDNLPVRIVRRVDGSIHELHVSVAENTVEERWLDAEAGAATRASVFGVEVPDGLEFPLADQMMLWVHTARGLVGDMGQVMISDYGASTAELAGRPDRGWLRTYDRHRRAGSPYDMTRSMDITCDVPFDQLGSASSSTTVADWVVARRPQAARLRDAATTTLLDRSGIGGFAVLTWNAAGQSLSS